MKILPALLVVALACLPTARAAENRYDVLSKALAPIAAVLSPKPRPGSGALALRGTLERLTGLPPALAGASVELSVESPDRLRVRAPLLDELVTVCRDRQAVWAAPGAKIDALVQAAVAAKKLPPPEAAARLGSFQLPVPEKQLAFLPALLQVREAGSDTVNGAECRVLDVTLMPELERALKDQGWIARLWIRADYRLARLSVARPGWAIAVRFDEFTVAEKLPSETWQPPADDVLQLDAPRFRQLLRALVR